MTSSKTNGEDPFMAAVTDEVRRGMGEGGLAVRSMLVCGGKILGRANRTEIGAEHFPKSKDIEVIPLDDVECFKLMQTFIARSPDAWREDIGANSLWEGLSRKLKT
jgi:hypothetical protein